LEGLPEKMKLYSQFLGKRPWFAGDKVKWREMGGEGGILPRFSSSSPLILGLLQITFVDFIAYDFLDQHRIFEPKCLDAFPNLKDFLSRFEVMSLLLPPLGCASSLPPLHNAFLVLEHLLRTGFI
jgi:glutathione S-transferase